jgi:hypothetical protein
MSISWPAVPVGIVAGSFSSAAPGLTSAEPLPPALGDVTGAAAAGGAAFLGALDGLAAGAEADEAPASLDLADVVGGVLVLPLGGVLVPPPDVGGGGGVSVEPPSLDEEPQSRW